MSPPERRRKPHRLRTLLLAAVLVAAALCGGYLGVRAARAGARGYALYQEVTALRDAGGLDLATLGEILPRAHEELVLLHRDLGPVWWVLQHAGWVPWVGPTLQAVPPGLDAGVALLDVGVMLWEAAGEGGGGSAEGAPNPLDAISRVLSELEGQEGELRASCLQASRALATLQQIEPEGLIAPLRGPSARVQEVLPLLRAGLEALPELPRAVGTPGERRHLLLAQNNDELRATGGFISSIGEVQITDGRLSGFVLRDSYELDNWQKPHPDPPAPLRRYMEIDLWVTRDANWWPDFATSARAVADLYELEQEWPVATVAAVDLHAAAQVLDVLAPLELPGGERLEKGRVAEGFRQLWSLPEEVLVTDGEVITTTRPYAAVEVEFSFSHATGEAWLDAVVLERAQGPGVNLVTNGSLERDADGDGRPDGWEALGLAVGDGLTKDVTHDGERSLYVRGVPDREKRLIQRLAISGGAGECLRLSGLSRAEGVEAKSGPYALTVRFLDKDGQAEEFTAAFPPFGHDWASAGSRDVLLAWFAERKDFIGVAVGAATQKMLSAPTSVPWLDLLAALRALLDERHIQVWSADEALQRVWEAHGWAGRLADAPGDYLLVVDSNVGYNKVTASVRQSLDYWVSVEGSGRPRARLTLSYENTSPPEPGPCDKFRQYSPGYEGLAHGCYWDYVRVYAPEGAELLGGTGGDEPWESGSERGRAVFSTYMVLQPGERREVVVEYVLPEGVLGDGAYTLLVQKQAGTVAHPLMVTIAGRDLDAPPPTGGQASTLTATGDVVFRTDLRVDRSLAVPLGAP